MRKTGVSELPLHPGRAPAWLFRRMVPLAGHIAEAIADEYSPSEFLSRMSDPFWFQAFGCVLGFDWHSSGLSTTLTGALKEAMKDRGTGLAVCGGKGSAGRKAPQDIDACGESLSLSTTRISELKRASRMSAKVDSACVQDGYQLYHHCFIFTERGEWCVVQQGMNNVNGYARRYHWLSRGIESFVEEPHEGIACDARGSGVLDMVSRDSGEARDASVDLVRESPHGLARLSGQATLLDFAARASRPGGVKELRMPRSHYIMNVDRRNLETLRRVHEVQPGSYEELLGTSGVGPRTVRALALISELVYGKPASWKDPARFSFCHGGKDGVPYPVDRETYDKSIEVLRTGIEQSRLGDGERLGALKRLEGLMR